MNDGRIDNPVGDADRVAEAAASHRTTSESTPGCGQATGAHAVLDAVFRGASLTELARGAGVSVIELARRLGEAAATGAFDSVLKGLRTLTELQVEAAKSQAVETMRRLIDLDRLGPMTVDRARSMDLARRACMSILRLNLDAKRTSRAESSDPTPWREGSRRSGERWREVNGSLWRDRPSGVTDEAARRLARANDPVAKTVEHTPSHESCAPGTGDGSKPPSSVASNDPAAESRKSRASSLTSNRQHSTSNIEREDLTAGTVVAGEPHVRAAVGVARRSVHVDAAATLSSHPP